MIVAGICNRIRIAMIMIMVMIMFIANIKMYGSK